MSICTVEVEVWGPHPGCREFMTEPEAVVRCGEDAVARFCVRHFFPPENEHDDGYETEEVYACFKHAEALRANRSPYVEVQEVYL